MEISKKALKSSMLKAGKRNYFFDVYLASNDKKYLKVTESWVPEKEGEKGKRNSFILFTENLAEFQSKLAEAAAFLA